MPMLLIGRRDNAGFTLLEVLVVLMLLALVSAAGISYVRPTLNSVKAPVSILEQAIARHRLLAKRSASLISIPCDGLIGYETTHIKVVECRQGNRAVPFVALYPDGSITLDALTVDVDDDLFTLNVDWLSGRVGDES
jgi:prepilin-type N-terminal cleavage/methylation domain-containing protein